MVRAPRENIDRSLRYPKLTDGSVYMCKEECEGEGGVGEKRERFLRAYCRHGFCC